MHELVAPGVAAQRGPSRRGRWRAGVWLLAALLAVANAAAFAFGLFGRYGWYDEAMHLLTPFALTLLLALYLHGPVLTGATRHPVLFVVVLGLLGLGLGALWEVAEWVTDQLNPPPTMLDTPGDTIADLVLDLAGALLGGAVAAVAVRSRTA